VKPWITTAIGDCDEAGSLCACFSYSNLDWAQVNRMAESKEHSLADLGQEITFSIFYWTIWNSLMNNDKIMSGTIHTDTMQPAINSPKVDSGTLDIITTSVRAQYISEV